MSDSGRAKARYIQSGERPGARRRFFAKSRKKDREEPTASAMSLTDCRMVYFNGAVLGSSWNNDQLPALMELCSRTEKIMARRTKL